MSLGYKSMFVFVGAVVGFFNGYFSTSFIGYIDNVKIYGS